MPAGDRAPGRRLTTSGRVPLRAVDLRRSRSGRPRRGSATPRPARRLDPPQRPARPPARARPDRPDRPNVIRPGELELPLAPLEPQRSGIDVAKALPSTTCAPSIATTPNSGVIRSTKTITLYRRRPTASESRFAARCRKSAIVGPRRCLRRWSRAASQSASASPCAGAVTNASIASLPGSGGVVVWVGGRRRESSSSSWRSCPPQRREHEHRAPEQCQAPHAAAGLVQLRVDRARGLRRHARDAFELLLARREQPLDRAEVPQQRAPPRRPDAGEVVEDRLASRALAALPVEAEREAVRLVADPLQQLEPGRVRGRARSARAVRARRPPPRASRARSPRRAAGRTPASPSSAAESWPLPPSIDDEVRRGRERLVVVRAVARPAGARSGATTTSAIAAKSSWPVERRARRTCGSAPSSASRPGTRPSSRRATRPGCSRCRSTRSAAAGSRG